MAGTSLRQMIIRWCALPYFAPRLRLNVSFLPELFFSGMGVGGVLTLALNLLSPILRRKAIALIAESRDSELYEVRHCHSDHGDVLGSTGRRHQN